MLDDADHPGLAATELLGHPAVDRARAAQHLVRTIDYQPERFARIRDEAVVVALRDGVALRRIAQALDLLPEDIQRMARNHEPRTPSFAHVPREARRVEPVGPEPPRPQSPLVTRRALTVGSRRCEAGASDSLGSADVAAAGEVVGHAGVVTNGRG